MLPMLTQISAIDCNYSLLELLLVEFDIFLSETLDEIFVIADQFPKNDFSIAFSINIISCHFDQYPEQGNPWNRNELLATEMNPCAGGEILLKNKRTFLPFPLGPGFRAIRGTDMGREPITCSGGAQALDGLTVIGATSVCLASFSNSANLMLARSCRSASVRHERGCLAGGGPGSIDAGEAIQCRPATSDSR
jgi:hypothetical protein